MDTSERYIKMCAKAQEIQDYKGLNIHNDYGGLNTQKYLFRKDDDIILINPGQFTGYEPGQFKVKVDNSIEYREFTWLPRQDQLQEIITEKKNNFGFPTASQFIFISNIKSFITNKYDAYLEFNKIFDSLEKIYLGFLMSEIYNKTWSDEQQDWTVYL